MHGFAAAALLALLFSSSAAADPKDDALKLISQQPAIDKAPAPLIERLHDVTVGSSQGNTPGYDVFVRKEVLTKTNVPGVVHVRAEHFGRNIFVISPNRPDAKLHDTESVAESERLEFLGGLISVPVFTSNKSRDGLQSTVSARLERLEIIGELFPLEVGKKLTVRMTAQVHITGPGSNDYKSTNNQEFEFVVTEKTESLVAEGFRIDGGAAKIEQVTRMKMANGTSERRATNYYSEKYRWIVAREETSTLSFGQSRVSRTIPVYVLQDTAADAARAELAKYDQQLLVIQRDTAAQYLNPRVASLAALAPSSAPSYSASTQPTSNSLAAFDCANSIGAAVKRTLIGYGLNYLAEKSNDFNVQAIAKVGAQQVTNCKW